MTLSTTQTARLNGLRNRATRYEVVAVGDEDGETRLVGYTRRRSRPGLLHAMRAASDRLIEGMPIGRNDVLVWRTRPIRATMGNGWTVKFSGRTERTAICEGEHARFLEDA